MKEGPDITRIAALIGDPARAQMLTALMGGRALTARELAEEAGVTPQTASAHLRKLEEAGLVSARRQGRHKYLALAGPEVAAVLESLMGLAARQGHLRHRPGPKDDRLRAARSCYRHLAGRAGMQVADHLRSAGLLDLGATGPCLSDAGRQYLARAELTVAESERSGRDCLDWSERRPHLGGALGRALLREMAAQGWLRQDQGSRIVTFSPEGRRRFERVFPA